MANKHSDELQGAGISLCILFDEIKYRFM